MATTPSVVAAPAAARRSGAAAARRAAGCAIVPSSALPSALRAPATTAPVARVDDVADRVDRDQRGDRDAADRRSTPCRCRPSSPGRCRTACRPSRPRRRRRCLRPARRARPRRRRRSRRRRRAGCARRRPRGRTGSPPARSARRSGAVTRRSRADRQADAALLEPAHHAAGRVEPEGAAAGQQRCACTVSIAFTGSSRSVSRVPGDAPRTSTPATAPPRTGRRCSRSGGAGR